jgi:hypothetical protein
MEERFFSPVGEKVRSQKRRKERWEMPCTGRSGIQKEEGGAG